MKHGAYIHVCRGAIGLTLIAGCATRGHVYHVGNACFHRAYHSLDFYHSLLSRNNPSYDKVILSPEWQDYPILNLHGLKIDLNDSNLVTLVTNNPSCHILSNGEFRLAIADRYVHLMLTKSDVSFPGFLLTNADLEFPDTGGVVRWPYSASKLSIAAQSAGVSHGGVFLVYGKHNQWDDELRDLIFDFLPEVNKVGRFSVRYPLISFAGDSNAEGNNKCFVGYVDAWNPKDEFFDKSIFRLDHNLVRCICLPGGKIISTNAITHQSVVDLGFVEKENKTFGERDEIWRLDCDDAFVEVAFRGERVSRLRATTSILCKDDLEITFPIQETKLENLSCPDYIERRMSK